MLKYKLTTQGITTYRGFEWIVGVSVETNGEHDLCGPGWLHYYHDPLLAAFLNPIHGSYDNPRLWEVEAEGRHLDDHGLKGGCTRMTLIREIALPVVTTTQRVAFAILCALEVCEDDGFVRWASAWLDGSDRLQESARAAAWATERDVAAERAAAWAAAWTAVEQAIWTEMNLSWAAIAVERAAEEKEIDLVAIAQKAMNY